MLQTQTQKIHQMEKVPKNSAADKIGKFRKGCKISKSLSPVIMEDADAATANWKDKPAHHCTKVAHGFDK